MTLLELLVALTILGLTTALAFSNVGPDLSRARDRSVEAEQWTAIAPVQILLQELAAGGIDLHARDDDETHVRFSALAPRLSPSVVEIVLSIDNADEHARLYLNYSGATAPSLLFTTDGRLRFNRARADGIELEMRPAGEQTWIGVASARFIADAPLRCVYDSIPRRCR